MFCCRRLQILPSINRICGESVVETPSTERAHPPQQITPTSQALIPPSNTTYGTTPLLPARQENLPPTSTTHCQLESQSPEGKTTTGTTIPKRELRSPKSKTTTSTTTGTTVSKRKKPPLALRGLMDYNSKGIKK